MSFTVLDSAAAPLARPLSPLTPVLLDSLPHYYQTDPYSMAAIDALGWELGRIENFLDAMRQQFFPQNADDTYGILGLWESMLSLPVQPSQLTLLQRQQRVVAAIRGRSVATGISWGAAVSAFLGGTTWTAVENTPGGYQLEVLIPQDTSPGAFTTGELAIFLRAITPAHITIGVGYLGGFVVDVSDVDQQVLLD